MINFINDRELARRFAKDEVPEKEQMWYLLIFIGLSTFFMSDYFYISELETIEDLASAKAGVNLAFDWIMVLAYLGTVYLAYRANSEGDGRNFVARYVSMGFPVMNRILLFVAVILLVLIPLVAFTPIGYFMEALNGLYFRYAVDVMIVAYFCVRLISSIKIASGQKS